MLPWDQISVLFYLVFDSLTGESLRLEQLESLFAWAGTSQLHNELLGCPCSKNSNLKGRDVVGG